MADRGGGGGDQQLSVGAHVSALYPGECDRCDGKIIKVGSGSKAGQYFVAWDDGDKPRWVIAANVTLLMPNRGGPTAA